MVRLPAVILLALFAHFSSFGQCCSAGNPAGGDGSNDGLSKNEFRLYLYYKFSLSEQYYHLDSKYDVPNIEKSYYDYSSLSATYGLLPNLSLHTELGYFFDKTQISNINNQREVISAHGLGDLSFSVRYIALKTMKPISQLVFSAGLVAPVGEFSEEISGVTIPVSLQPSSGAFKYNASVFYLQKNRESKFGWSSFALFEFSQMINKDFLVYDYGNYLLFSLAGNYSVSKKISLVVNAKLEWRGKDERENGIIIESSGSKVVFFNPQLVYSFHPNWALIALADIPVYKYVDGYQLTNKASFQFGLRRSLVL